MWKRLIWILTAVIFTVPASVPGAASAQVTADAPPFSADEIAIYRDFLLHYPKSLSELIGMRNTSVAFDASWAFGLAPNPPNVEIPAHSGRQLPPEIMALTEEKGVPSRMAAAGQLDSEWRTHLTLSEIAFDSKQNQAAFVFSSLQGKGGTRGTVVYELKNGEWKRKGRILNVSYQ
jgi:hypothetical protein